MILSMLMIAAGCVLNNPADEIVRSTTGEFVTITNAGAPNKPFSFVLLPHDSESILRYTGLGHGTYILTQEGLDVPRAGGPLQFGCVADSVYRGSHRRPPEALSGIAGVFLVRSTTMHGMVKRISDVLHGNGGRTREQADALMAHRQRHGTMCTPMMGHIEEHAEELYNNWDITCDYVYTTLDDVTVLMLRQGQMHRWTLHGTGWGNEGPYDPDWQTHAPFNTNIEGVFRMFMAGPELANHYIIDETGAIYTGYDRDHRQIGTFLQYHNPRETTLTIIFEDQMTQKIAVVHATEEGDITALQINWRDESFADDFITTELDDTQTAGIRRLTEVMREDAGAEE
ncbi:MAG: hypothetical protein ACR2GY_08895 [Phycisphaerales bacterium]